jgi:hypothetical protein
MDNDIYRELFDKNNLDIETRSKIYGLIDDQNNFMGELQSVAPDGYQEKQDAVDALALCLKLAIEAIIKDYHR